MFYYTPVFDLKRCILEAGIDPFSSPDFVTQEFSIQSQVAPPVLRGPDVI